MPGKVLPARRNAVPLECVYNYRAEAADLRGIGRQGPIANHVVGPVAANIQDRSEVQRNAHGGQFIGQRLGESLRQRAIALTPQRLHRGPLGKRGAQARYPAALLVDAHPERHLLGQLLNGKGQFGYLLRRFDISTKQHDPAQIPLPGKRTQLRGNDVAVEPRNHELSDMTM